MDVYEIVTNKIIDALENGVVPWQRPWSGRHGGAYNLVTKKPYSFLNQILLKHQDAYLTFNQAKALGGKVKKGAKAEFITFWKMYPSKDKKVKDKDGNEVPAMIPVLRYYNVFWIGDCEGIEVPDVEAFDNNPIDEAEKIIAGYLAREDHLRFQNDQPSNEAYYSPLFDEVVVPMMDQYEDVEEYYSTAFHEFTHSTGAKSRLDRHVNGHAAFGSNDYGKEELVAEMGAAMLVNISGIDSEKCFKNSAAYIDNWLNAIKGDKHMIVSAAGKAQKAVEFILNGKGEV